MMKNDIITLFNRLTSSELADYTLFSNIVDLHYEKFKYLYYMLKDGDLSRIANISCTEDENTLYVTIEIDDTDYINPLVYSVNARKSRYNLADDFNVNISWYDHALHIDISVIGNEREGDLYAGRFI